MTARTPWRRNQRRIVGVAVAFVPGECRGTPPRAPRTAARDAHGVENARGVHALMRLPRAERDGQRQPVAVSDEVQLGRAPAAAAPQGVVCGLAVRPVFPRARGDPMRPDMRAVDAPEFPVNPAGVGQFALEHGQDAVPQPLTRPAALTRGDSGPRAVTLGQVAPRAARRMAVEHAVEDAPMIHVVRSARLASGQERRDACPLRRGRGEVRGGRAGLIPQAG